MLLIEGKEFLSRRELLNRGWDEKDIKKLVLILKTPNPSRPDGCLMNFYDMSEIRAYESSSEFNRDRLKAEAYKRERAYKWAKTVKINFTGDISIHALAESIDNYDGQVILSIIRHRYSNYTKLMDSCDSRVASGDLKKIIRLRLLKILSRSYTGLKDGAMRQWTMWYPGEVKYF